jgi:hypothetical protein
MPSGGIAFYGKGRRFIAVERAAAFVSASIAFHLNATFYFGEQGNGLFYGLKDTHDVGW